MPNYTSRKIEEFRKKFTSVRGNQADQLQRQLNVSVGSDEIEKFLVTALEEQKAAVVRRLERQKERIYPEDDVQAQEWKGMQNDHIDTLIKGLDKEPIIIDNFTGGYQPKGEPNN